MPTLNEILRNISKDVIAQGTAAQVADLADLLDRRGEPPGPHGVQPSISGGDFSALRSEDPLTFPSIPQVPVEPILAPLPAERRAGRGLRLLARGAGSGVNAAVATVNDILPGIAAGSRFLAEEVPATGTNRPKTTAPERSQVDGFVEQAIPFRNVAGIHVDEQGRAFVQPEGVTQDQLRQQFQALDLETLRQVRGGFLRNDSGAAAPPSAGARTRSVGGSDQSGTRRSPASPPISRAAAELVLQILQLQPKPVSAKEQGGRLFLDTVRKSLAAQLDAINKETDPAKRQALREKMTQNKLDLFGRFVSQPGSLEMLQQLQQLRSASRPD